MLLVLGALRRPFSFLMAFVCLSGWLPLCRSADPDMSHAMRRGFSCVFFAVKWLRLPPTLEVFGVGRVLGEYWYPHARAGMASPHHVVHSACLTHARRTPKPK